MRNYSFLPIFLTLWACSAVLQAQQAPFLNHYTWSPRLFNPAAQGAEQGGEIIAVYRSQFQGLESSVRPSTYLLHGDFSPLVGGRIGIGAQIMGDKVHLLSRFQLSGFFGYQLIQLPKLRLALGATMSIKTQNFDFEGVRVSDVLDLNLFYDQVSQTGFDGGPGVSLEYRTTNGSLLALDAAAIQLFSSDLAIRGATPAAGKAIYNMVPHVLTNLRYRYQGRFFALEPNVAYRLFAGNSSGVAGVFDVNVNAFFLENNRLMVGAGMRTDQGGLHFQLGVVPVSAVRLVASAELHTALGTTYEVGVSYAFGKSQEGETAPVLAQGPADNLVQELYQDVTDRVVALEPQLAELRKSQEGIASALNAAADPASYASSLDADSCAQRLAQTSQRISDVRQAVEAIDLKRRQAELQVQTVAGQGAMVSPATQATLRAIQDRSAEANTKLADLISGQQRLQFQCASLQPLFNERACVRSGDAKCLEDLFNNRLREAPGIPGNLYPVDVVSLPNAALVTYHYPDDAESYALSPETQALASHILEQAQQLERLGVRLERATLVTELQEDKSTLAYNLNQNYDGLLGQTPVSYFLVDNLTGATTAEQHTYSLGDPISLEALGALKLAALQQFLIKKGMPGNLLRLQVRFNHTANSYREETKVILQVRR